MGEIVCAKCNIPNEEDRNFCKKCGSFLRGGEFEPTAYELPEVKMMRIAENLLRVPHQPIEWDELTDIYTSRVEKLRALFSVPGMGSENNSAVCDKMNGFLNLCRNPDFQIAFVGTIKTGKSTLINALLGKNYASMDVTPETAALTKFRACARDYVDITFYSQSEWEKLWNSINQREATAFLNEYKELGADQEKDHWVGHEKIHKEMSNDDVQSELSVWSSSKRPEHYFVKEIEVGISTLPKNFPKQVVFVDTPGLSDPVAYRSELTRNYIRRANAVFVCVEATKIQSEEINTIATVFSFLSDFKSKVHIIATHWDVLANPEEDWEKQRPYFAKRLTGPGFFDTRETAMENIMHSAAYIHNLCRDYDSLDKKGRIQLKKFALNFEYEVPEDLNQIEAKTNIKEIMDVIRDKLVENYKRLMTEDIGDRFRDIIKNLTRINAEKKESYQDLLAASRADEATLQKRLDEQRKRCDNARSISKQLDEILKGVQKRTKERADKICKKMRLELSQGKK